MKINLINKTEFKHHRDGWKAATQMLSTLHNPIGIHFYDWADKEFKHSADPITKPWSGIFHNVLKYPKEYTHKYNEHRILPLVDLVQSKQFKESLSYCHGLFTLCRHTAKFLQRHVDTEIEWLWHPVRPAKSFSWKNFCDNPKFVSIGQWMRKQHSFFSLKTQHTKLIPKIEYFQKDYEAIANHVNLDGVNFIPFLDDQAYDNLLSESVVFLDLYDCGACNTILECIIRNTPILINILPATVQYLEPEYPLFYESIEDASNKIKNFENIRNAHLHLANMNKSHLDPSNFLKSIVNSSIYKNIPAIKFA